MSMFLEALAGTRENISTDPQNLFGQFVGEWDFEWVDGTGTDHERHILGEWIFSWILEGNVIQDVFICPSRKERELNPQPDAEYGTTVRFYNPKTGVWNICYGYSGNMTVLDAKANGEDIVLTNRDNSKGLNQWVFTDIEQTSFHWINRSSMDGGLTWHINGELFAQRRNA